MTEDTPDTHGPAAPDPHVTALDDLERFLAEQRKLRHALSILLAVIMGLALILAAALAASIAAAPPARAGSAEIDILVVLVDWTTQEKIQIACTTEGNAYACARLNNNDMTADALNAIPTAAGPSPDGARSPLRAEIHANSIVIRSDALNE